MAQAAINKVLFHCRKSPTGKWDESYCSVHCNRGACTQKFIIKKVTGLVIVYCQWCDEKIDQNKIYFRCPLDGHPYALCTCCLASEKDLDNKITIKIDMKKAKELNAELMDFIGQQNKTIYNLRTELDDLKKKSNSNLCSSIELGPNHIMQQPSNNQPLMWGLAQRETYDLTKD